MLNNILANDNLNPAIQTELVQVLSTNGLSSESQAQLIETLSAKNLDSSTQTTVINTLFEANLSADSLSGVLNILSNIILSPINIQKIESLFLNSTNITSIEESLTILSHALNNDLIQLGPNGVSNVLEQNKDLNGCLQGCSNNGDCLSENNTFVCFCRRNYEGKKCENIYNPCLVNPCLNEGVCILLPDKINLNTLDLYCSCSDNYNGSRCEEKIDRCQKQACSNNGYCVDENNNATSCVCKQYFSGPNCELQDLKINIIAGVKVMATIIASIFLGSVPILTILNDFFNKTLKIKKNLKDKKKPKFSRLKKPKNNAYNKKQVNKLNIVISNRELVNSF